MRRAIDFREGDKVYEKAVKTLIRAAVALNDLNPYLFAPPNRLDDSLRIS